MADATIDIKANISPTKESLNGIGESVASSILDGLKKNKSALESKTAELIQGGKNPRQQRSNIITLGQLNRQINKAELSDFKLSSSKKKSERTEKAFNENQENKTAKDKINLETLQVKLGRQILAQKKEEFAFNKKLNQEKKQESLGFLSGIGRTINSGLTVHSVSGSGTTSIDEGGVASLGMRLGKVGAIAAAAALVAKFVKNYAGGNIIGANAASLGTGFNASTFGGLQNSQVVNQNVSENIGSALIQNRTQFAKSNVFRRVELNELAAENIARFRDSSFESLRNLDPRLGAEGVQSKIFEALKRSDINAALDFGKNLGYSDETILALRSGKNIEESLKKQATERPAFNDPGALNNAFGITGGIEGTLGKVNSGLTEFIANLANINSALPNFGQRILQGVSQNPTGVNVQTPWSSNYIAGNSSAGNT